jgi:hypothetical protein
MRIARVTARAFGLALALGAGSAAPASAEPVAEIFLDPSYRFCHEADYPLLSEERAWCPLIGEQSEVCPTLPKACSAPPAAVVAGGDGYARRWLQSGREGDGRGASGDGRTRAAPREPDEPPSQAMSFFAQLLFYAMIAAGLGALVWAIARAVLRQRDRDDEADAPAAPALDVPSAEAKPPGSVETAVERLLARARAAAARGDFDRALADTHAALLRRLEAEGLVDLHPSRTNGDYVRALRDRPDLRKEVRAVFRDVERVQFGAEPPSRSLFQAVYDRVAPLAARSLGAAALCLTLAMTGLGCERHAGSGAELSGDTSPSGSRAIVELLAINGVEVRHRSAPITALGDARFTLVLLPDAEVSPEEWKEIFAWVERGGVVIDAGAGAPLERTRVRPAFDPDPAPRVHVVPRYQQLAGSGLIKVPGRHALEILSSGPAPLLRRERSVYATYEEQGSGIVMVFADGELFKNISLAAPGNEDLLAFLLGKLHRSVELCDRWTGAGATTPFESVRSAELTPIIGQLLLLAALLLLWKGAAFGALRDPKERSRRAFADHARALGLCYARARASGHVLGVYAGWAVDRLRESIPRGSRAQLLALAEAVAARTGRTEAEIVETLVEAQDARDAAGPPSLRSPASRRGSARRAGASAEEARRLALMRELTSFLNVTAQRARPGPARGRAAAPARAPREDE